MRYIKEFANATALQAAVDNGELGRPYLCYLQDQGKIAWNESQPPHDYSKDYLTLNIVSAGTITYKTSSSLYKQTYSYSIDNGETWLTASTYVNPVTINVSVGDKILFKSSVNKTKAFFFNSTALFKVEGNIMSLIYGDNFINKDSFPGGSSSNFFQLFQGCTGLTNAENLVLPATTLSDSCYKQLFYDCTALTTAPTLPATALTSNCYSNMFVNCHSLNYIKCLATDISTSNCTSYWVQAVPSGGTFVKKSGVNWETGKSGIPSGWTVIEE